MRLQGWTRKNSCKDFHMINQTLIQDFRWCYYSLFVFLSELWLLKLCCGCVRRIHSNLIGLGLGSCDYLRNYCVVVILNNKIVLWLWCWVWKKMCWGWGCGVKLLWLGCMVMSNCGCGCGWVIPHRLIVLWLSIPHIAQPWYRRYRRRYI